MRPPATQDSSGLLAALGIIAYAASLMTHEALGHGGYCLAAGGHTTLLTPWVETCQSPRTLGLGIKAAGLAAQFAAGLLAWLTLHLLPSSTARLRFFLWLYMAFCLFDASGYLALSGITGFGDAAELIAQHRPSALWRGGLTLLGAVVYFLAMQATALELNHFSNPDGDLGRLLRLVRIPYTSAGLFALCTSLTTLTSGHKTATGAAFGFAAASSLGAGSGLFALPYMQRRMQSQRSSPAPYIEWSAAWGALAATVIMTFLFYLGPGLQ